MNKPITNILAHEYADGETYAHMLQFRINDDDINSDNALFARIQLAVNDYIKTEEGEAHVDENNGHFNYGELSWVPNECFEKHGITLVDTIPADICVDTDTNLLPAWYSEWRNQERKW